MSEKTLVEKLKREGFREVYVQDDPADTFYPDHEHAFKSAHVILEGEMELTIGKKKLTLKKGDRNDVPPKTIHSAKMGLKGCKYIVAEE